MGAVEDAKNTPNDLLASSKGKGIALKGRGFEPRRESETNDLRGAEAPLYHDGTNIWDFFRSITSHA